MPGIDGAHPQCLQGVRQSHRHRPGGTDRVACGRVTGPQGETDFSGQHFGQPRVVPGQQGQVGVLLGLQPRDDLGARGDGVQDGIRKPGQHLIGHAGAACIVGGLRCVFRGHHWCWGQCVRSVGQQLHQFRAGRQGGDAMSPLRKIHCCNEYRRQPRRQPQALHPVAVHRDRTGVSAEGLPGLLIRRQITRQCHPAGRRTPGRTAGARGAATRLAAIARPARRSTACSPGLPPGLLDRWHRFGRSRARLDRSTGTGQHHPDRRLGLHGVRAPRHRPFA